MNRTKKNSKPGTAPELMTVEEAAHYMGMSPGYVRKLSSAGRFPHTKHGLRHMYKRSDMDAFMDSCLVRPAQPGCACVQHYQRPPVIDSEKEALRLAAAAQPLVTSQLCARIKTLAGAAADAAQASRYAWQHAVPSDNRDIVARLAHATLQFEEIAHGMHQDFVALTPPAELEAHGG